MSPLPKSNTHTGLSSRRAINSPTNNDNDRAGKSEKPSFGRSNTLGIKSFSRSNTMGFNKLNGKEILTAPTIAKIGNMDKDQYRSVKMQLQAKHKMEDAKYERKMREQKELRKQKEAENAVSLIDRFFAYFRRSDQFNLRKKHPNRGGLRKAHTTNSAVPAPDKKRRHDDGQLWPLTDEQQQIMRAADGYDLSSPREQAYSGPTAMDVQLAAKRVAKHGKARYAFDYDEADAEIGFDCIMTEEECMLHKTDFSSSPRSTISSAVSARSCASGKDEGSQCSSSRLSFRTASSGLSPSSAGGGSSPCNLQSIDEEEDPSDIKSVSSSTGSLLDQFKPKEGSARVGAIGFKSGPARRHKRQTQCLRDRQASAYVIRRHSK